MAFMITIERVVFALKFCAALGSGLMAGVFFAFSVFVMSALASLPPAQGIAAMQAINVKVLNPLFMLVFMGTALLCLVSVVVWQLGRNQPGATWLFRGCVFYLIGTFGVTVAFNVPLNDALAKVQPTSAEAAHIWANFLSAWLGWNHLRAFFALAAMAAFIWSLCERAPQ